MKRALVLAIGGLFAVVLPAATRDRDEAGTRSEVRVAPLADTFVREGDGASHGDREWLEIGRVLRYETGSPDTSDERWSFLKFDTSPAAHVSSARLRLYGARSSKGVDDTWAKVLSASSSWKEHGLKGSFFPAYVWNGRAWHLDRNREPLDRVKLQNDRTDRWYEWDVSAWVVQEKNAGRHVLTLVLVSEIRPAARLSTDGVASFHSREAETNPPELVLVP